MPSSTFRAWFIGLIWVVLISGINLFFNFRYPSVYVSQVCLCPTALSYFCSAFLNLILCEKIVAQVLSLPMGKAWARLLPNISLFGIPLNPGPFNIKEHTIITIMAGASEAYPYAVSVSPAGRIFVVRFSLSSFISFFRQTRSLLRNSSIISMSRLSASFRLSSAAIPIVDPLFEPKNRSVAIYHVHTDDWLFALWDL